MSESDGSRDKHKSDDEKLEEEVRSQRKFTMAEAFAREFKGSFKGVPAVPPLRRAQSEIDMFLRAHVRDASGALRRQLEVRLKDHVSLVASHLDEPLAALKISLERILRTEPGLVEFVRQVDQRSGQMFGERPHFQRPGQEPHPNDEYTHASVRAALETLIVEIDAS